MEPLFLLLLLFCHLFFPQTIGAHSKEKRGRGVLFFLHTEHERNFSFFFIFLPLEASSRREEILFGKFEYFFSLSLSLLLARLVESLESTSTSRNYSLCQHGNQMHKKPVFSYFSLTIDFEPTVRTI